MGEIDPDAASILDVSRSGPSLDRLGVERARELVDARPRPTITHVAEVVDGRTPRSGVGYRAYRPAPGMRPVIVFAHSGGWVLGSVSTADETARRIAVASGCVVVSVEYRLAPEHVHPAAVEDLVEVIGWLASEPEYLGVDGDRLLIAGESSGAHIAVSAALLCSDRPLRGLLLICPPIDPRMRTTSWTELGHDYIPVRSQMAWMWSLYYGVNNEFRAGAPDPSAADLDSLPPTTVIVAEFDPLRDEGIEFAERCELAGVPTALIEAAGQLHPVAGYAAAVPACDRHLRQAISTWLDLAGIGHTVGKVN